MSSIAGSRLAFRFLHQRGNRRQFVSFNQKLHSTSKQRADPSKKFTWMLIFPLTSFGLGTWQVHRLQWKKDLIRELEERTQGTPIELQTENLLRTPDQQKDMEYTRVSITGHFDHSKEILLGPRSRNTDNEKQQKHMSNNSGQSSGGLIGSQNTDIGYHVVTAFVLASGERILVNRGWVHKNATEVKDRKEGQVDGSVKFSGLLRKTQKKPSFMLSVDKDSLIWHHCDIESFANILDTSPILIDADAKSTIPGGPIGGQTRVILRNEHLQYIITWYSLCAATLFMYYKLRKNPHAMFRG